MNAQTARNIMRGLGFSLMVLLALSACQRPGNTGAQSVENSPAVLYRALAVEEQLVPAWVIAGVDRDASSWTIEVHTDPDRAWSDGDQCLEPEGFRELMTELRALRAASTAG